MSMVVRWFVLALRERVCVCVCLCVSSEVSECVGVSLALPQRPHVAFEVHRGLPEDDMSL